MAILQVSSKPAADAATEETYRKTQAALLRSRFVVAMALRRPGIADLKTVKEQQDPAEWLFRTLDVVTPDNSELIQVRLRGDDPAEIAKILGAVTAVYLEDLVQKDRDERRAKTDALEKKFKEVQSELRRKREQLEELERTVAPVDELEIGWLQGDLDGLRSEATSVRIALRAVDAEIAVTDASITR